MKNNCGYGESMDKKSSLSNLKNNLRFVEHALNFTHVEEIYPLF